MVELRLSKGPRSCVRAGQLRWRERRAAVSVGRSTVHVAWPSRRASKLQLLLYELKPKSTNRGGSSCLPVLVPSKQMR